MKEIFLQVSVQSTDILEELGKAFELLFKPISPATLIDLTDLANREKFTLP